MAPVTFVQVERFRGLNSRRAVQWPGELLQLRKVAKPDPLGQLRCSGRSLCVKQVEVQAQGGCNSDPGADGYGRLAAFDSMQRDARNARGLGRCDGGYSLALAGSSNTFPQKRKTLLIGGSHEGGLSLSLSHHTPNCIFLNFRQQNTPSPLTP